MASGPDPSAPGDDQQGLEPVAETAPQDQPVAPEQAAAAASVALAGGHSWDDVQAAADTVNAPVARPSLNDIWYSTMQTPGRDAINEGAGPIGEALIGLASGSVVGAVRGAVGTGVLSDIAGAQTNPIGRIASMGVETVTPKMALLDRPVPVSPDVIKKIFRYGAGAMAGSYVMQYGLGVGKGAK